MDGREVGVSPYTGMLTEDEHRIHAIQDGMTSEVEHIDVKPGRGVLPEIRLKFHAYADLGLPSGTLWGTCNVGAEKPEDPGEYFAWSEVQPTNKGTGENFVYKSELAEEDDAAFAHWGTDWCMPSLEQLKELVDVRYTLSVWIMREGMSGLLIKSRRNGNSIFLPAAGYSDDGICKDSGAVGNYWSRTNGSTYENGAYQLYFVGNETHTIYSDRFYGRSVRAVRRN